MRDFDRRDALTARSMLLGIAVVLLIIAVAGGLLWPELTEIVQLHFEPGLGMKSAAVVSFFVTLVLLAVLAIAAGDGLIGELQFMIAAFLAFFLIFWLLIAWIF